MILMAGIRNTVSVICLVLFVGSVQAQITSGRIVFERKTNLKKKFGSDDRLKQFINDDNKTQIDKFELVFDGSRSAFIPIPKEVPPQGFMKYLTTQNSVYQDQEKGEKVIIMDLWGTLTGLKDSIEPRLWKVTESKRRIGGYMCRKAVWEKNDSTRIYAWFSVDVVPSIGPEGFGGLPGAILGLATEDGGIIYFATEVKALKPEEAKLAYDLGKMDVYSKNELRTLLEERMGKWMKPKDLDEMFSWL